MEASTKDLYFNMVPESYEWALRRLDAVESRIQHLMTLAPAILLSIALPTAAIAGAGNVKLSLLAYLALIALGGVMITGIWARSRGGLRLLDQQSVDRDYLEETSLEDAKWNAIKLAGEDFDFNACFIQGKARYADIMGVLLLIGTALGVVWAASVIG